MCYQLSQSDPNRILHPFWESFFLSKISHATCLCRGRVIHSWYKYTGVGFIIPLAANKCVHIRFPTAVQLPIPSCELTTIVESEEPAGQQTKRKQTQRIPVGRMCWAQKVSGPLPSPG